MQIFISHATANAHLANTLAEIFESLGETTFLSSRAGDLRADGDWLRGVEDALQQSDAYIVLLTPESTLRPWVNFEAGAAWFTNKKLLFVRVQALAHEDIPLPISSRQIYALDDEREFEAILDALGLPQDAAHDFMARLIEEAAKPVPVGENEGAWEGIQIEGVFYAWAGLLHRETLVNIGILIPALVAGLALAGVLARRINQRVFRYAVAAVVISGSVMLLSRELLLG